MCGMRGKKDEVGLRLLPYKLVGHISDPSSS